MKRRRLLRLTGSSLLAVTAGCQSRSQTTTTTPVTTTKQTTRSTTTSPSTQTEDTTPTTTQPGPDSRETIHVGPDGSPEGSGAETDPLGSIQRAVNFAGPGDTVAVQTGRYRETVTTARSGTADAPITLTGPQDAILAGEPGDHALRINHSHIHVTGLTFDGLVDTDNPDDPDSYAAVNIFVNYLSDDTVENPEALYVTGLRLKPHAVGNTQGACLKVQFVRNTEIGEFRVLGPAGQRYLLGDEGGFFGEVVYLGLPIGGAAKFDGVTLDQSRDVHIHHINNSAGHPHAELVDVKPGTQDVLIEYCTDGGGAGGIRPAPGGGCIGLKGQRATVRWCRLERSRGDGVYVGSWHVTHPDQSEYDIPSVAHDDGQSNSLYGNNISDYRKLAVRYPQADGSIIDSFGPDAQRVVCGNEIDGQTHGSPSESCGADVPTSDEIGHLGGNSPWDD